MTSDKSFFERLGRQIRYAEQARCGEELSTFKTPVFKSVFHWVLDTLAFFCIRVLRLRSIARAKAQQEGRFLEIIKEYGPRVQEQFKLYEQAFMDWEYCNRAHRNCGDSIDRERAARAEANRLTVEAQEKLAQAEYPFTTLTSNLVTGMEGWTSVDNAMVYWDTLTTFFSSRIAYLGNMENESWSEYRKIVTKKTNHYNIHRSVIEKTLFGVLGALVLFGAVELYRWINPNKQEMQMIASLIGFWGLLLLCRLAFTEKALARVRFWAGGSGIILGMSTLLAITTKLSASNNSIDLFLKSLPVIFQLPAALICMVVMMAGLVIGFCSMMMLVVCILNSLIISDDEMF